MKIYTRTGDKGTTGLFGGKRVRKDNIRIEAVGAIDEVNSVIGVAIVQIINQPPKASLATGEKSLIRNQLSKIQGDLFEIGAVLATPQRVRVKEKRIHKEFTSHLKDRTSEFEELIDGLTTKLPPMKSFILPGGSKEGAFLHLARTVCRRAERRIVAFSQKERVDREIIKYMNRLSDLLFTMARFVNTQKNITETPWKGLK